MKKTEKNWKIIVIYEKTNGVFNIVYRGTYIGSIRGSSCPELLDLANEFAIPVNVLRDAVIKIEKEVNGIY